MENAVVRARINEGIKIEASAVLAAMGLTVSDAFRLLMTKVAHEKTFPFELLTPNQTTIDAMKAARLGEMKIVHSTKELFESLDADD